MSSLDSPSFTKLYKQYRLRLISRINRLIGCRETASDLAQEAYMRLLDNRDLSNVLNLSAYLFQIGHNLVVDYQRDPLNKIEYLLLDEAQPCPLPQPQEIVSLRQQCSILIDAIATMPQGCRDVFLLRKIDGLSYREISIRLNISEKTVQQRLVQAMLHCHRSV